MLGTDSGRRVAIFASTGSAQEPAYAGPARPGMGAERMAMTQWMPRILWWRFGYQPRHRSTRPVTSDADWFDLDPADDDPRHDDLRYDDLRYDDSRYDDPADDNPPDYDPVPNDPVDLELDASPRPRSDADAESPADSPTGSPAKAPADESSPARQGGPVLRDHLSSEQLRHLLEGCALDDVARIVRPLVQVIAHSSHTTATLASTWGEFRKSTRDAYALHVGACRWSDFFRRDELGSFPAEDAVEIKLRQADHAWRLLTGGVP
jgi:hypothetical protein